MNALAIETAGLAVHAAILSPKQAAHDADYCNSHSGQQRRQRPPEISDGVVTLDQNFERPKGPSCLARSQGDATREVNFDI